MNEPNKENVRDFIANTHKDWTQDGIDVLAEKRYEDELESYYEDCNCDYDCDYQEDDGDYEEDEEF